ncbi:gas vesicle protein [bacterium]|nr:gas vesicle protein [bacterium]MCG2677127.1 gas vesicle protein [bacterium]
MEPTRNAQATLVDLLDRILEKGLVINADLIIAVAGVPLLGVNLRAALAGMETMLKYGVMQAWDEKTRAWEREHRKKGEPTLSEKERVVLKTFGSHYYNKGIYNTWRLGYFYLTNKRLLLYQQEFDEIIFQVPIDAIRAIAVKKEKHFTEEEREILYLLLKDGGVARLHSRDIRLKENLEKMGLALEEKPLIPELKRETLKFLNKGEEITHRGKMWHQMASEGIVGDTWRPGQLYVTDKRACWYYDFDRKIAFEAPLDRIVQAKVERRDLGGIIGRKMVLVISYGKEKEALFSTDVPTLGEWGKILSHIISGEEMETCPQCGREAPAKELLERGCTKCGWVSPRLKKKLAEAV